MFDIRDDYRESKISLYLYRNELCEVEENHPFLVEEGDQVFVMFSAIGKRCLSEMNTWDSTIN
jgi:hypothetical protein